MCDVRRRYIFMTLDVCLFLCWFSFSKRLSRRFLLFSDYKNLFGIAILKHTILTFLMTFTSEICQKLLKILLELEDNIRLRPTTVQAHNSKYLTPPATSLCTQYRIPCYNSKKLLLNTIRMSLHLNLCHHFICAEQTRTRTPLNYDERHGQGATVWGSVLVRLSRGFTCQSKRLCAQFRPHWD